MPIDKFDNLWYTTIMNIKRKIPNAVDMAQRDENLLKDYENMSLKELVVKYDLTPARIYQIIKKWENLYNANKD